MKAGARYKQTLTFKQCNKARWLLNVNFPATLLCEELGGGLTPQKLRALEENRSFPVKRIDGHVFYNGLEVKAWAEALMAERRARRNPARPRIPSDWAYCGRCKKSQPMVDIERFTKETATHGAFEYTVGKCKVCGKKSARPSIEMLRPAKKSESEMSL